MFTHIMIGSNDLERSRRFYDALFEQLGAEPGVVDPRGRVVYRHGGGILMITSPINGEPANPANGNTIGFAVDSPEQGDAWHAAGIAHGGTSIEDPPGVRTNPPFPGYLAYLRDPDGHKLCVMKKMD